MAFAGNILITDQEMFASTSLVIYFSASIIHYSQSQPYATFKEGLTAPVESSFYICRFITATAVQNNKSDSVVAIAKNVLQNNKSDAAVAIA